MITDESVEKALNFYRDNADQVGTLRGRKAGLDHRIKIARADAFLEADGTVAQREAEAMTSQEVFELVGDLEETVTELATIETLLKSAELRIDAWRTHNANQRRGNI